MGIFDRIFARKEQVTENNSQELNQNLSVSKEIDCLLLILANLGLLKVETIRERISEKEAFDEHILEKLDIKPLEDVEYVDKYFGKLRFGYGSYKIAQVRESLTSLAREKMLVGLPKQNIVDLLISLVINEIDAYKNILIRFNESLKQVEENEKSYSDMVEKIAYWKEYYKEQELGYPVSLDKKIESMVKELESLPYGGYGEKEIKKFEDSAKRMIEEGRLNNEESITTLNRITTECFNPMKNRFLGDVDRLKKKLQMIDESPYLSEFDKEQNKQKTIKDFNQMNGHIDEPPMDLEQLKKNLASLEYGGYGEEIINKFAKQAETMISDGKRIMKPEEEVKKDIQASYKKLVKSYEEKLETLKDKIQEVDISSISEKEKEQKRTRIMNEFHDEMGLPIDYEDRINSMIEELEGLDRGGYGELKISEFRTNAFERLERANTRTEVRDALREIREIQEHMIQTYNEALRKLYDASERTSHDRHLTNQEKERAIEDLSRDFKFNMGYRMNFEKYIENRAEDLATLEAGGYGKEAVDEFRSEAKGYIETVEDEKERYEKIRQRFDALRRQYKRNVRTFQEWKKMQLKNANENERDTLEKDLNVKIAYMLSLSPKALYEYYLEDDRKKKESVDKHNYVAAFKFLARQEAKYGNNDAIYQQRLQELEEGKEPYTSKELEEATAELEILSLTRDDLSNDEKIISLMEYIDSTLLRQMMYAEASLMKSNR